MTRPNIKLGKSLAEKMEELNSGVSEKSSEITEEIKFKKSEVNNIAREKMEAMSKHNLRPVTIGVKAELELDDDLHLTIVAKKLGKVKQELAAEYILKGLEKDMQKIGIFEHKK